MSRLKLKCAFGASAAFLGSFFSKRNEQNPKDFNMNVNVDFDFNSFAFGEKISKRKGKSKSPFEIPRRSLRRFPRDDRKKINVLLKIK